MSMLNSGPRPQAIVAAIIGLTLLGLLWPLLADRLPAMRDSGHYYYPLFKWCTDEWGAGRLPLWNAGENGGTAVCADPTASLWYPGKLVFALPVDFAVRYKLYVFGHVALCAAAAYWLARRWGASVLGAGLAALSYSCGGSVLFQHCNVVYLVGAAWLPVAVGQLDSLVRARDWHSAVRLGVVLALMVLGGDPQMAYHVLLLGGLYVLVLASGGRQPAQGVASIAGVRLALLAASAAIAFLLAAVQVLPSAEATSFSRRAQFDRPRSLYEATAQAAAGWFDGRQTRAGLFGQPRPGTHHATAYDFSIAPWRLVELVWPNCGGRMFPTHRRWFSLLPEEPRVWSPSLYLGLVPLLLGLSVLSWRAADSRIRWLTWTGILFTLGSLGTFGLGWLARQAWLASGGSGGDFPIGDPVGGVYWLLVVLLPKYVYFRYPAKLLVVASLAIAILAALGWDRALARQSRRLSLVMLVLGLGSGTAALAALIAARFIVLGADMPSSPYGPFDSHGAWTDIVSSLSHTAIVSLAAAWLIRQASGGRQQASGGREPPEADRAAPHFRQSALLVLCAAELALANAWLVPTAPARLWREPSALVQAIGRDGVSPRVYRGRSWWPPGFYRQRSRERLAEMVAWERQTLAGRYALLDRIAVAGAQLSLKRGDYQALVELVEHADSRDQERLALSHLGVTHLILPAQATPDFAERVAAGLPADAALWRMQGSPLPPGEQMSYRFEPAWFYRGAAISAVSWVLLAALAAAGAIRNSPRPMAGAVTSQIE